MLEYIIIFLLVSYAISRYTCGRTNSKVCLIGRTAIITGASGALGLETALNLASRGCRLILADIADMDETKKKIIKETHNSNVETKYLNLASLKSVREFAEDINSTEEKIDILINNAGVGSSFGKFTEDGLPYLMQINHYGHFLLTHLLIDRMKKSDDPRIIFVSSIAVLRHNVNSENMKKISHLAYSNSKVCKAIAAIIFSEKLKEYGFSVNALHPGIVPTNILLKSYDKKEIINGIYITLIYTVGVLLGKTIDEGVQTTLHLATSDELKCNGGNFYCDCKPFPITSFVPQLRDQKFCNQVWRISEELVGLKPSEKL